LSLPTPRRPRPRALLPILRSLIVLLGIAPSLARAGTFAERFEQIKKTAPPKALYRLLQALPKGADLHQHFNHSNLAEDWLRLATDPRVVQGNGFYTRLRPRDCPSVPPLSGVRFHNVQRSTYERLPPCRKEEYVPLAALSPSEQAEWLSALRIDRPGEGREEFFEQLGPRIGELGRGGNLASAMLLENLRRFGREGLRYAEIQIAGPRFLTAAGEPLEVEQAVQVLRRAVTGGGAQAGSQTGGVTARFIAIAVRSSADAEAQLERAAALVARHRDLWVGVGFAGREQDDRGHPLRFLETFRRVRQRHGNIPLSLHAGESTAPGTQVRDSLLLGARRIGHGVNLLSDPQTLLLMRGGGYLVEINLISNQLLEYVTDVRQHPFAEYLRLGIPVCLNTDDRGAWDSNMTDEYFTAVTAFDLRWDELVKLGRDSLEHSFADSELKAALLQSYQRDLAVFMKRFDKDTWADELRLLNPMISGYAKRTWGME
jgi:adenosine deaminase CECR1